MPFAKRIHNNVSINIDMVYKTKLIGAMIHNELNLKDHIALMKLSK